jgi:predicted RNA-binding protein
MFEEDFVSKDLIEVEIQGRKFKIRDLSGPEMDSLTEKYLKIDMENESVTLDLSVKNNEMLKCVIDAPYEKDGKKFSELSGDEKLEILNSLKNSIRGNLIKTINKRLSLSDELKKK